jgi:8-oxo-dGTP diphosphatase
MTLLIMNANPTEPTDYLERRVAKAVIVNDEGLTLTQGPYLIGGGVEEGETFEQALHREAIEEAGIEVEIVRPLGVIVGYRDALKKKYFTQGYFCTYLRTVSEPTTTDTEELDQKLEWLPPEESIKRIESEIEMLKHADQGTFTGDEYQSRLYNRQMTLAFLKEAFKQK